MTLLVVVLAAVAQLSQPQCALTLTRVVELGSADDPVARSTRMRIAASPHGFFMSPEMQHPQIAHYSPTGAFVKLFDRMGRGPGELSATLGSTLEVRGDTLFAFNSNRLLTFDLQLRPIATRTLEVEPGRIALLADGRIVVTTTRRPRGVLALVHVLDAAGRIAASVEVDSTGATGYGFLARLIAPSTAGGFWVAPPHSNWIRKYTATAALQRHMTVARSWVEPWGGASSSDYMQRPRGRVTAISELAPQRLFVLGYVADSQFKVQDREPVLTASENLDALYDSILEVVDVASGKVIASTRHPSALRLAQGSKDLVFAAVETADGDIKAVVYRVVLTGCS